MSPIFRVPKRRHTSDVQIVGGKKSLGQNEEPPKETKILSSSQTRARATEIHDNQGNKVKVSSHERSRPKRDK